MGLSFGVHYKTVKDVERGNIAKCVPETTYRCFPHKLKKEPYSLLLETNAFHIKDSKYNIHDVIQISCVSVYEF